MRCDLRRGPVTRSRVAGLLMRTAVLTAIALASIQCAQTSEPRYSPGLVALEAPQVYDAWWQATETCASRTGDIARVRFYVLPDADSVEVEGSYAAGFYLPWNNTIVLAGRHELDGPLVRHEMLHSIIHGGHALDYFLVRCAGVVSCSTQCKEEGGGTVFP